MANIKKQVVTKEYFEELQAEYRRLLDVERPQVLEELAAARAQGDLSENADYASAREQQAIIAARIAEIENILKHAKILDVSRVTVKYLDFDEEETFEIVGTIEADPFENKISNDSPLGKSVLTHNAGDVFFITTESGKELKLKLISKD